MQLPTNGCGEYPSQVPAAAFVAVLQVKDFVKEISWLLKFQTDKDHGYAGLDGLHTSEYPVVR